VTDLSDFGAGVDSADGEEGDGSSVSSGRRHYPRGRCRALNAAKKRCRGHPAVSADEFCHMHSRSEPLATIDDGPKRLLAVTAGVLWANFENEPVREAVAALGDGEQS
jgi:hypothetical protein